MSNLRAKIIELQKQIESLENLRAVLGDDVVNEKQTELQSELDVLISTEGGTFVGDHVDTGGGKFVGRDEKSGIFIEGGETQIRMDLTPALAKQLSYPEALQYYLDHLIATHQHLRLQGISAGSQPLSVSLEKVYVSLKAMDQCSEGGKKLDHKDDLQAEYAHDNALTIGTAMQRYRRLVVIGDPGCGKTTLLAYLALTYARQNDELMIERLGFDEATYLPVILPLRNFGQHLRREHPNPGKDGPALLCHYLYDYFAAQEIHLPDNFFEKQLEEGTSIILLDGMDEVADKKLRERIARLIEQFVARYPEPRYIVTSRIVGYEGAARISAEFGLAKVSDFSPAEVRQFVRDWTRVVETTLARDDSVGIIRLADTQAERLIAAIESNARVAELAVNPLLLTVIALVHRYRANLPERRSELYEEAVEVLLGNWDAAKPGMKTEFSIGEIKLDSGDRRSLLEPVAFWMHEREQREIELDDLRPLLTPTFENLTTNQPRAAQKAVDKFLQIINERSGILVERGIGVYSFAHLTFQEYLAARALADHKDALTFSVEKLPDPWWREVILLQAGYLSTQGKRRVSELIDAILTADKATEPEPHHHLLLAAECLFDVGPARVEGDLLGKARARLTEQAEAPFEKGNKESVLQKVTAMNALARIESGQISSQFWKQPWGEPAWITIPEGEFWMGSEKGNKDEKPIHRLDLPTFRISRVPITNSQYGIYVADTKANPPEDWRGGEIPKGMEKHPVVNVSWHDAIGYCRWLSEKTGQTITLPSEAEWEKAARGPAMGSDSQREYPWGKSWEELHANTSELGLSETTPVGLFIQGASPYGALDLSGNVYEWTRTIWDAEKYSYPYRLDDGRESIGEDAEQSPRVVRGGSWLDDHRRARCAFRYWRYPLRGTPTSVFGWSSPWRILSSDFWLLSPES